MRRTCKPFSKTSNSWSKGDKVELTKCISFLTFILNLFQKGEKKHEKINLGFFCFCFSNRFGS
jgi:hypothetical protein